MTRRNIHSWRKSHLTAVSTSSRVEMIALEISDHRAFAIAHPSLRNPILSRFSTSSRVDIIAVEIPGHRAFTIAHGSLRNPILSRFSESPAELSSNARSKTFKSCCAVSKRFRHRASIFSKSVPPPIFRIRIASRIRLRRAPQNSNPVSL